MKASELRIGSIVMHEDPDEVVEGIHYGEDCYRVLIGNYLRPISEIKPIPLTEDFLLKMGFAKDEKHKLSFFHLDNPQYCVFYVYSGGCWHFGFDEDGLNHYVNEIVIQYVHQLQNLYFALTGDELTIK